jgi:hypothetical protein
MCGFGFKILFMKIDLIFFNCYTLYCLDRVVTIKRFILYHRKREGDLFFIIEKKKGDLFFYNQTPTLYICFCDTNPTYTLIFVYDVSKVKLNFSSSHVCFVHRQSQSSSFLRMYNKEEFEFINKYQMAGTKKLKL